MRVWLRLAGSCAIGAMVASCSLVGPSCVDERGVVLQTNGVVLAGKEAPADVVSPKSSNLVIRLHWNGADGTLGLRATITDCGIHAGCTMTTTTPSFGPGGPSPVPQPWPPGVLEMEVDGSKGKAYRIEVVGDEDRELSYTLEVVYLIQCES